MIFTCLCGNYFAIKSEIKELLSLLFPKNCFETKAPARVKCKQLLFHFSDAGLSMIYLIQWVIFC